MIVQDGQWPKSKGIIKPALSFIFHNLCSKAWLDRNGFEIFETTNNTEKWQARRDKVIDNEPV